MIVFNFEPFFTDSGCENHCIHHIHENYKIQLFFEQESQKHGKKDS